MTPIALALALFLQAEVAPAPADAAPEAAAADHFPPGAPHDDYQFVAWCYGSLRAYLDLHDQVMPEVTRIEGTYRPPGRKLADDLKVYADMQKDGKAQLKVFQSAIVAAEKASLRPINTMGAAAVQQGRSVWQVGPGVTPARLAQEWMSWALPARCETTAKALEAKATLMGAALRANAEPEAPPPEAAPAPAEPRSSPVETLLKPADPAPAPPAETPPPPNPQ
jgi:hypothetical protein